MEGLQFFKVNSLVSIVAILLAISSLCFSLKLGSNGGYDLVVAIKEGENSTVPVEARSKYIQNVKGSFQLFSNQLYRATKKQFFIKSVELIIPNNWNVNGVTEFASNTYQTADFHVFGKDTYPHAENPNICGLPGKYVELPLPFFDNANFNDFGQSWKTLMVLFARYRYGVWDEHGYVGDERFPYYKKNYLLRKWEITGCSNTPIVGKFLNVEHQEDCAIDWTSPAEALTSCRFVPDRVNNTASTSLMHFHWLDSVVDFCDIGTHDRIAENKQNIFCNHKSVMEVIRDTPDYKTVTNPSAEVPALSFKAVKQSDKPLFYVLLDKGLIQGLHVIARLLPEALADFFRNPSNADVIASVGSYPSGLNNTFVKEEVQWSQVGPNLDAFLQAVGVIRIDGEIERDFSRAILEVAEKIREINHPNGAVILVVKYGADLNNLYSTVPESDLIIALNSQNTIVHAIELGITSEGSNARSHLAQLARATTGSFTTLTNVGDARTAINNVLRYVNNTISSNKYIELQPKRRTIVKHSISSTNAEVYIPVPIGNVSNMEVYYSSADKLDQTSFTLMFNNSPIDYTFYKTVDWNEDENKEIKYTYRFRVTELVGISYLSFSVNCSECGTAVARAEIDDTTLDNVQVEVLTSGDIIDLSQHQPLSINVKVTKSGVPVKDVTAFASISNNVATVRLDLHDDGVAPDAFENDGVFSAYFAPQQDGSYKISATIEKLPISKIKSTKSRLQESSLGRILPIDQGSSAGCEAFGNCTMESIEDNFMQTIGVPVQTTFLNVALFQPKPAKINFLLYLPLFHTLVWPSPRVQGRINSVSSYEIRYASSRESLLTDFENCEILNGSTTLTPSKPGLLETFVIPTNSIPRTTTYYAVRASFNGNFGDVSNINGFESDQDLTPETPDPTASTTTSDPTASTASTGVTDPSQSPPTSPTASESTTRLNFSVVNKPIGITAIFIIAIAVLSGHSTGQLY